MYPFLRAATAAALFSFAASLSAEPLSPQEFATQAAASEQFELRSSQMALELSKDETVRTFAQDILRDHGRSSNDLKDAARQDKIQLPQEPAPEAEALLEPLKNKSGKDFDQAYFAAQLSAHEKAVGVFDSYSKDGAAGSLKTFAQATYPTLRMHLVRVRSMMNKE